MLDIKYRSCFEDQKETKTLAENYNNSFSKFFWYLVHFWSILEFFSSRNWCHVQFFDTFYSNILWVVSLLFLKLVSSHNSLLGRGETSLNKLAKLLWYKYLFVYHPLADGEKLLILYSGDGFRQTRQECKNENIFEEKKIQR